MVNSRILFVLVFSLLCISFASAQAVVAGTVYNSDFSDTIEGADMTITCSGSLLTTNSITNGVYGVKFDTGICNLGDNVDVVLSNGYLGSASGTLVNWPTVDPLISYLVIINVNGLVVSPEPRSGGGGNYRPTNYYLCGNGVCDSGETISTCPEDCILNLVNLGTDLNNEDEEEPVDTNLEEPEETQGFFSRITGAVVGAVKSTIGMVIIIFILVLAGMVILVRRIKYSKISSKKFY